MVTFYQGESSQTWLVSDIYELQLECPEKWDDDDVPQLTKSYFRY